MASDGAGVSDTSENEQLQRLRVEIDRIDTELLALISRRAEAAQQVAEVKTRCAGQGPVVFYRPEREAQVLKRIREQNPGPLPDERVVTLFRELMSACLALEQPLRIAYLGPQGTFTQDAAVKQFGHAAEGLAQATIRDVFRATAQGEAHYGVVPVENSAEGMVSQTLDTLVDAGVYICGEVELPIHHHLLGLPGRPQRPRELVSHQQSLAQCRNWIATHLPEVHQRPVNSNAEAARAAAQDPQLVAIASSTAAEIYGLEVIAANIEDLADNTTRFLVIGGVATEPSGHDKTSVVLSMANRPGALHDALGVFARSGIGLTRLETRPARNRPWAYRFFIDFEGHRADPKVACAIDELSTMNVEVQWLGSYPCAAL